MFVRIFSFVFILVNGAMVFSEKCVKLALTRMQNLMEYVKLTFQPVVMVEFLGLIKL